METGPVKGVSRARSVKPRPRVLCVDDEVHILEGLKLHLRRTCDVVTATGGLAALDVLGRDIAFAAIISDMRMPGMNGSALLAYSRKMAPDAVRLLLTGQADLTSAIAAVNDGQIFRFLTKPCPPDQLVKAVDAAIEQHRLVTGERVLLEQTLNGSIRALAEVLSLSKPALFGRATRVSKHVARLASHLDLPNRWEIEVAALLSNLGAIILPEDTVDRLHGGSNLSGAEQAMTARIPGVTEQLLANIPRLEGVREILASQHKSFRAAGADLPIGSRLLRIAVDHDVLETRLGSSDMAIDTMRGRSDYDPSLLESFAELLGNVDHTHRTVREVRTAALRPGMVFMSDVLLHSGVVLAVRGYEITHSFLERLRNLPRGAVREPLQVMIADEAAT